MTQKIVGKEGNAFWFEVESVSYYGENATLMLVTIGDRRDPESMEILRVRTKSDDNPVREEPNLFFGMMKSALRELKINWEGLPQESVTVPAGQFAGCYKNRVTASFLGFSQTSDTWAHSAVPISGAVKSVGIDKPTTTELVGFGLTGAETAVGF